MIDAIGLLYGSTTGSTRMVAELVSERFHASFGIPVESLDIADYYLEEMLDFQNIILGIPTWNVGQMQADWDKSFAEFDDLNLTNHTVAIFGLGDQIGYPDTFADAVFFVATKVQERGARLVGKWPSDGYEFQNSWALQDEMFLGLILDEHSQANLTMARVEQWISQLIHEFSLDSIRS